MSGSHHRQPSYPTHPHHSHHHSSGGQHPHHHSSGGGNQQSHHSSHSHSHLLSHSHSHSHHRPQPSYHRSSHSHPHSHPHHDISPPSSSSTVGGVSGRPGGQPSTQLGSPGPLSLEDLAFLRQQQRHLGISPAGSSSGSTPGHASGLSLDPNALTALSAHFDQILVAIAGRVQTLSSQTLTSTQSSHRHASHIVDRATVEIENLRDILRQCDELETEFLKIKRLGEMVKGFKGRIEGLERRVGR